jgi:hypothetical protein
MEMSCKCHFLKFYFSKNDFKWTLIWQLRLNITPV